MAHGGELKVFDVTKLSATPPSMKLIANAPSADLPMCSWAEWDKDDRVLVGCRRATLYDATSLVQNSTLRTIASTKPLTNQNTLGGTAKGKYVYISYQFEGLHVYTWKGA